MLCQQLPLDEWQPERPYVLLKSINMATGVYFDDPHWFTSNFLVVLHVFDNVSNLN